MKVSLHSCLALIFAPVFAATAALESPLTPEDRWTRAAGLVEVEASVKMVDSLMELLGRLK